APANSSAGPTRPRSTPSSSSAALLGAGKSASSAWPASNDDASAASPVDSASDASAAALGAGLAAGLVGAAPRPSCRGERILPKCWHDWQCADTSDTLSHRAGPRVKLSS